jgi:hypothetical protein
MLMVQFPTIWNEHIIKRYFEVFPNEILYLLTKQLSGISTFQANDVTTVEPTKVHLFCIVYIYGGLYLTVKIQYFYRIHVF